MMKLMTIQLNKRCLGIIVLSFFISACTFAQSKNLDYYINTGLVNSPLLKDYQNQVAAYAIDSQRLRATFRPQVAGISSNAYSPVVNGWGYDQALSNIGTFNEMVNVNQTFAGRKNLAAQYRGIGLVGDSIRNAQKL